MGEHEWMLSVFDDLQRYAEENGLDATAEMIATKKEIARWEIGSNAPLGCKDQGNVTEVLFAMSGTTEIAGSVVHFD